jgi:hypothetical protein
MTQEELYPCDTCGKLRTASEGGTTFTVCDECWDKHYKKERVMSPEEILIRDIENYCSRLENKFAEEIRDLIKLQRRMEEVLKKYEQ